MPKHDYHWTFGNACHIEFQNGGDPIVVANHAFLSDEGCAAVSDSNGVLLFYTDGLVLYDALDAPISSPPLGGSSSSSHAAIIVPPAGGGSLYHIFAVHDVTVPGPVRHTGVSIAGGVAIASPPTGLAFGPQQASERLAAIPHADCDKYWVIAIDGWAPPAGPANLYAMLVDSDMAPMAATVTPYPYAAAAAYCCKVSPDGQLLAVSANETVDILSFNRTTGAFSAHSQIMGCVGNERSYGVEFSPNSQYLYVSSILSGKVNRHTIALGTGAFAATDLVGTSSMLVHDSYRVGALQLAPNGKIYGAKVYQSSLFEIADPDNPSTAGVKFNVDAVQADGKTLILNEPAVLGLPTFTRIADDCVGNRCGKLAAQVNEQLAAIRKANPLRPCDDRQPAEQPECHPLGMEEILPWTSIRWGDSACDCIEGDDTEIMHLTVCNPYENLILSNLTVQQLVVVDAAGNPVPNLPDGSPSIQLVPVGPYCFDDIAPCACVTREFALRLRGAPAGPYRILVRGLCFDAWFQGDGDACFTFEVCRD